MPHKCSYTGAIQSGSCKRANSRNIHQKTNFPRSVCAIQKLKPKKTSGRKVIEANKAEMLIPITICDTVICAVLVQPSSTCTGYPILSRLIVVVGNVAHTTFTVVDLSRGVCSFPGTFCWSGTTSVLASLRPNTCGLFSLPFFSFLWAVCCSRSSLRRVRGV
jgi:hypothetical protein